MVKLTDRPDMTIAVYYGRKATKQQHIMLVKGLGWSNTFLMLSSHKLAILLLKCLILFRTLRTTDCL